MVSATAVAATIERAKARRRLQDDAENIALLLDLELVFLCATRPEMQPGGVGLTAAEIAKLLGCGERLPHLAIALDRAHRAGAMVPDKWKAEYMIVRRWRAAR